MNKFIKTLSIKNFKSIKDIKFDCKRINVFIGKPNVGKSNILESIGLLSFPYLKYHDTFSLKDIVRFNQIDNLFYDSLIDRQISLSINKKPAYSISFDPNESKYCFSGKTFIDKSSDDFSFFLLNDGKTINQLITDKSKVKYYRFDDKLNSFQSFSDKSLIPPSGINLENVILTNKELRQIIGNLFSSYGKTLVIRPNEHTIEEQKKMADDDMIVISYPYLTFSDGMKRLIFNLSAIISNSDNVIILEEPESHYFPYYAQMIAEKIANSSTNQFFLTTHNPYFLNTMISETPMDDINIVITYYENYQTKIKLLSEAEIQEILEYDIDAFFNLERFIED
jgi:AAA15 family ATPase/GTPase